MNSFGSKVCIRLYKLESYLVKKAVVFMYKTRWAMQLKVGMKFVASTLDDCSFCSMQDVLRH